MEWGKSGGMRTVPSGVQGRSPGRGPGDRVPRSWNIFRKYTTRNLRPCENEKHNLMPLMLFFIAVHTGLAVDDILQTTVSILC